MYCVGFLFAETTVEETFEIFSLWIDISRYREEYAYGEQHHKERRTSVADEGEGETGIREYTHIHTDIDDYLPRYPHSNTKCRIFAK